MDIVGLPDRRSDEWVAGYSAAVGDALAIVESLGGPSFSNLSGPVLSRLRMRLIELTAEARAAAA